MANPISGQLYGIVSTLICGLFLGFVYELFRMVRGKSVSFALSLALDVLFCLLTACCLFLLGMGPGKGDLRLYMPALVFAGVLLFLWGPGPLVRRLAGQCLSALGRAAEVFFRPGKIFLKKSKNLFSIPEKWFTIKKALFLDRLQRFLQSRSDGPVDDRERIPASQESRDRQRPFAARKG